MSEQENKEKMKYAIINGTNEDVEKALKKVRADEILETETNNSALHMAAYNGEPEKLAILLKSLKQEKVIAVNTPNKNGFTPLMDALYPVQTMDSYAKEHTPEETKIREQWYKRRFENLPKTVKVLLDNGANPSPQNRANRSGADSPNKEQLSLNDLIEIGKEECNDKTVRKALDNAKKQLEFKKLQWKLLGAEKLMD